MEGIGRGKLMQLHKQQLKKLKDDFKLLRSKAKGSDRKQLDKDFQTQEQEIIARHQQELSNYETHEDKLPEPTEPEHKPTHTAISKAQKNRLKKEQQEKARDEEREKSINTSRNLENEKIQSLLSSLNLSSYPVRYS